MFIDTTKITRERFAGGDIPIHGINKEINYRKNPKYSPNLYRFLTYKDKYYTNIFQDSKGIYYIGLRDKNNIWCGANLMNVFCMGGRADCFSYATSITEKWKDVTKWFWEKYLIEGKAIYDSEEFKIIH